MIKNILQILFALMVTVSLAACHDHEVISVQPRSVSVQLDTTRLNGRGCELQRTVNGSFVKPACQVSGSDTSGFILEHGSTMDVPNYLHY